MTSETPKSNAALAREICLSGAAVHSKDPASERYTCARCAAIIKALDDAEERGRLRVKGVRATCMADVGTPLVGEWCPQPAYLCESHAKAEFKRGRQDGLAVAAAFLDEKGLTVLAQHMRSLNAT